MQFKLKQFREKKSKTSDFSEFTVKKRNRRFASLHELKKTTGNLRKKMAFAQALKQFSNQEIKNLKPKTVPMNQFSKYLQIR